MHLPIKEFTRLPFIVISIVLLIIFIVDFGQRVWRPLKPQEANITPFSEDVLQTQAVLEQPAYLKQWLQMSDQNQVENNMLNKTESLPEVVAMPGSTQLNDENVRIRAIFISNKTDNASNSEAQAMAVAEVQNIETGNLKRLVLRRNDVVSGWEVTTINANRVVLTNKGADERDTNKQLIQLYVFKPITNTQSSDKTINDEPKNNND